MSRTSVPERGVIARGLALLGLAIFLAPLLLLLSTRSADAATLCLPEADETACIAGTMGSRADPIEGVDVILTKPDGSTETQTTEADGKFSFTVTEPGDYLVGVDPDTLPKGSELRPPAEANLRGPDGALKVDNVELGKTYGADAHRPRRRLRRQHQQVGRVPPVQRQRHPARPAAGAGQRRPQPDLRHHRDLELRARRAGDPGRHARLLSSINVHGNATCGWVECSWSFCCGFSGWFQDRILWQPLRRRGLGLTQLMIVTIGLSLALQYTYQYTVGARTVRVVVENAARSRTSARSGSPTSPWRRWRSPSWCWPWSATPCCAPASAGPPARCPTTRRWPRPPASTPTR